MSKSIENNFSLISDNINFIQSIQTDINDLQLGIAIKDEHDQIKYSGYTDWRLKLEIYSNITMDYNLDDQLLYNNNYILDFIDYIHILADYKEFSDSNILEFINYSNLTTPITRNYQNYTYQNYIYDSTHSKLLFKYTLNILLNENYNNNIPFSINQNNLFDFCYFVNNSYIGSNITDIGFNNLIKGWNTINWFFIYEKNINKNITLGFNPININELKIDYISGILNYNPNTILANSKTLTHTISTINNSDNEFFIKQNPIQSFSSYTLTKTYKFNFNSIDNFIVESNITFNNINLSNIEIYLNSINIINKNDASSLVIKDFTFNNCLFQHNQEINSQYNYTFNSNIQIHSSTDLSIDKTILINIEFNTTSTTLNYDLELEFYVETRNDDNKNNLLFIHKENDSQNTTNNKIIFMNDGSIGIGTDNTGDYSLFVNNISSSKKGIYCADDITILSDQKFKTNIKTIQSPIEQLMALRGVSYNRIDRDINQTRYGFIAQEVQKVLPEACDGNKGIKTTDIVALLVEGFKELVKKM
jgi:hypothetical protein